MHGYPFIHPLLGTEEVFSGYRLEYAPGTVASACRHTVETVEHFDEFDHRHPWFVPAGRFAATTPERVIATFSAQAGNHGEGDELEAELRKSCRKLAFASSPDSKLPATGTWDYLLISASHARSLPPFGLHGMASRTQIVATDVHGHGDRDWLMANACAMTTGEYLQSRAQIGKKADTTRQKMLELLSLIANDADTEALEAIFRQEAKLSYSLLRLVNSAAIAPRSPITSFAQAINMLGRRQLERWLQLLIYADPNNGQHPNPLLYKAAARGLLLEQLISHVPTRPDVANAGDSAFMVGSFSLLDVLLNMSMGEILQQLPLCQPVHDALARHSGPLGQLLAAIESAEGRDLTSADQQLHELGIPPDFFLAAQMNALAWANRIRPGT